MEVTTGSPEAEFRTSPQRHPPFIFGTGIPPRYDTSNRLYQQIEQQSSIAKFRERKAEGKPLGTVPHGSYTLVKTPGGYTALKPRIKPKSA
jgi:hypothetical protein